MVWEMAAEDHLLAHVNSIKHAHTHTHQYVFNVIGIYCESIAI